MIMQVRLTFIEKVLGTKPSDRDVFVDWIASKHPEGTPQKDELENADKIEDMGTTVFHREDGVPGIYDYQVKGFMKEMCGAFNRWDAEYRGGLEKLTAYKTRITGCIFPRPRFIKFKKFETGFFSRPLKAETAQGPRVALVNSEIVKVGGEMEFEVEIREKAMVPYVREWFKSGVVIGIGQWRSGGNGRFQFEEIA